MYVYLLVDSGSTKTDWVYFTDSEAIQFQTEGLNPSTQPIDFILSQLEFISHKLEKSPLNIYYYGAGTSSPTAKNVLSDAISRQFPNTTFQIHSDLLGAGRALCNRKKGIICILGTGSHAALCDGNQIIHQLPSLGFILGDEGSGNHLAKKLLAAYFYEKLDSELSSALSEEYPILKTDFIYNLYQSPNKQTLLGSFAKFVIQNKKHKQCKQFIEESFNQFIQNKLTVYQKQVEIPVHLCGSVGFYLQEEFFQCLISYGFTPGECIQKPIEKLLAYHQAEIK